MATYIRLTDYKSSDEKEQEFFNLENRYEVKQEDFSKIPASPIAYWVSENFGNTFINSDKMENYAEITGSHNKTANNELYVRFYWEINSSLLFQKWVGYAKGGEFRKWFGNTEYLVDWSDKAKIFYDTNSTSNLISENYWFKDGITYTDLTTRGFNCRTIDNKSISDMSGPAIYIENTKERNFLMGLLNSNFSNKIFQLLNPTLHIKINDIKRLPIIFPKQDSIKQKIETLTQQNINISKEEWDSRETSWDFTKNELIKHNTDTKIETAYSNYCNYWKEQFNTLHQNEEELNRLFIDIYELQDELTPDVELKDITILKNEAKIIDGELVFQREEIMKQFISYGIGVMFGRYSLDSDGLLIANMGQEVPTDTIFEIDDDNVIPVLEDDYFKDDIASRFVQFVKATFGEEDLSENIRFIESSLGTTLRKYFVKGFYEDHIKRYKKRPIYWMVASPKKGFMSLIYMHRYKSDVFATVQNSYLREYITKLEASRENYQREADDASNSNVQRNRATKEVEKINKILDEVIKFDREVLTAYAQNAVEIDLDDGVKVNYCKFKAILYEIKGLCK